MTVEKRKGYGLSIFWWDGVSEELVFTDEATRNELFMEFYNEMMCHMFNLYCNHYTHLNEELAMDHAIDNANSNVWIWESTIWEG